MKKRICAAALSLCLCASMSLSAGALSVEQARELLAEHYIAPLNTAAQQAETLDELFAALSDPYTVYYTAEEYGNFLSSVNGEEVVGIGVSVQTTFQNGFAILAVLPDSPALEAGLKAGDVVTAVDGVTLSPTDSIVALLSGTEDSSVTVTVRHADGTFGDFTMTRRRVLIPIVTWEQQGSAGYIDCSTFGESTDSAVMMALSELEQNTAVWIMDLRDNPGGTSDSAAFTATHFLGGGTMVYFRNGQGDFYATRTPSQSTDLTDCPLIVLTGSTSASAAELFSGTIRDYGAGIAIGQRTFGKGVAQVVLDQSKRPDLFEEDALKITAYRFFSPRGVTNHLMGLLPSLMLEDAIAPQAARLLSSPAPEWINGWMKLELAGHSFYLDPAACREDPEALSALLQSLPPAAKLYRGICASHWFPTTPAEAAARLGLGYEARTFSDVADSPYRAAIETLACYGLLSGDENGNFLPGQNLTRAEFAAMLAAAFQLPEGEHLPFTDTDPDAWYAGAVSALTARGFLTGSGDGMFHPERALTNQELHTVLAAIAVWANLDAETAAQEPYTAYQWLDYYRYPEWAQEPTRNLYNLGIRVDRENPDATVTRGAAAQMLFELMEAIGMFWY